jgi:glycosyltransferase involved in cell wall biosynthesis
MSYFINIFIPILYFFNIYTDFKVNIIGSCRFRDSLSRNSISFIECLKDDIDIVFSNIDNTIDYDDIPQNTLDIIKYKNNNIDSYNINFFVNPLGYSKYNSKIDKFLDKDHINIAYSMFESDRIPSFWVDALNQKFDAVIVPDKFLLYVYKKCGVNIPIFVAPLPIFLDDFLDDKNEHKFDKDKPFTFGCSAMFVSYKNQEKIIKAFARYFKNNSNFRLKLHGRVGNIGYLKNIIESLSLNNVDIILKRLSHNDYIDFIKSLDCYVFISKGEGFSITPREAMACAIPVILSDNTVHKTIVKSGFVYPIKSKIRVKSMFQIYFKDNVGFQYDCNEIDIANGMKDIYLNYDIYKNIAKRGKEWVKKYSFQSIKGIYLSLFKPRYITLSDNNNLIDGGIITNSINLYNKLIKFYK